MYGPQFFFERARAEFSSMTRAVQKTPFLAVRILIGKIR